MGPNLSFLRFQNQPLETEKEKNNKEDKIILMVTTDDHRKFIFLAKPFNTVGTYFILA